MGTMALIDAAGMTSAGIAVVLGWSNRRLRGFEKIRNAKNALEHRFGKFKERWIYISGVLFDESKFGDHGNMAEQAGENQGDGACQLEWDMRRSPGKKLVEAHSEREGLDRSYFLKRF